MLELIIKRIVSLPSRENFLILPAPRQPKHLKINCSIIFNTYRYQSIKFTFAKLSFKIECIVS